MIIRVSKQYLGFFILFILALLAVGMYLKIKDKNTQSYVVQFAYPVSSIDPTIYDDWESAFIGNHIYYRLLPDEDRPELPFITNKLSITCSDPSNSSLNNSCKVARITFNPKTFYDCRNQLYTVNDVRNEFEMILTRLEWILPHWKRCSESNNEICVEGKYQPDLLRRMRDINFRFGWSKNKNHKDLYGAGIYCLKGDFDAAGKIYSGILSPSASDLPVIKFHTSQSRDDRFNLAIYGNKNLLAGSRINIPVHTPLAYYVVSNSKLENYKLLWNAKESKTIVKDYLTEKDLFFSETPEFINFAPKGKAVSSKGRRVYEKKLTFALPNYLPGCEILAGKLNKSWNQSTRAVCLDIVDYINKKVVVEKKGWDGFLVGVSASSPSREALKLQYFSPYSSSSWTYDHPHPEKHYYLIGIGQSLVTVDGNRICGIKPNPLGLGDIFITDLISCN